MPAAMIKRRLRRMTLRVLAAGHVITRPDRNFQYPILLDYPVRLMSRNPPSHPHPGLYALMEQQRPAFENWIGHMTSLADRLAAIPARPVGRPDSHEPIWLNVWFYGLDAAMLYTVCAKTSPARLLEVGSGYSTQFARRALVDHGLPTTIISIDPQPRVSVEAICDQVIRQPLEEADPSLFGQLQAGDILLIDCSHRIFQSSDVAILLLEALPYLAPGVLVHFHDIYLPYDYPETWQRRYYSEQYGVAAMLLADQGRRYEILMANYFVTRDSALRELFLQTVLRPAGLGELDPSGSSLWLRVRGESPTPG